MEYTNSQMEKVINEHIHKAKYRDILKEKYIDGLTFEEIAGIHDMSVRQISYIICRESKTLFRNIV